MGWLNEHNYTPVSPDPLVTCPDHREEPICGCGANASCPNCGHGRGVYPCECTPGSDAYAFVPRPSAPDGSRG